MEPERGLWAAVMLAYLTDVRWPENYQAKQDAWHDWHGSRRVFNWLADLAGYNPEAAAKAAADWINERGNRR